MINSRQLDEKKINLVGCFIKYQVRWLSAEANVVELEETRPAEVRLFLEQMLVHPRLLILATITIYVAYVVERLMTVL